jgi:hypothetical protein
MRAIITVKLQTVPDHNLSKFFQLPLNVVPQLAKVFKLIKIAASFVKWISHSIS